MWIFTTIGFFSVVADRYDKKGYRLMVRARARGDLENFKKRYCHRLGPIVDSRAQRYMGEDSKGKSFSFGSDYPFRAFVGRRAFANAMRLIARDLTYTNFKSEVMREQGGMREGVYMRVWSVMKDAQSDGKLDGTYKPPVYSGDWKNSQLSFPGRGYALPTTSREHLLEDEMEYEEEDEGMGFQEGEDPSDPFYWRDGEGHTSEDAAVDTDDYEDDMPLQFDSIEEVLEHFRSKRDDDSSDS